MFEIFVIFTGCFIAAFINAAFATGGVYIMLICVSAILPLTSTIPLLSAFSLPSLVSRIILFWQHIDWPIVKAFALGSTLGVFVGGQVFISINEQNLSMLIGLLLLLITWWPSVSVLVPKSKQFLIIGLCHSFFGTILGVGGILQSTMVKTALLKNAITATLAGSLFCMGVFKIANYSLHGFSYQTHLHFIFAAMIAGYLGAWFGKHASNLVSESLFRLSYKVIITIAAIRFIYLAVLN